jgi:hypothetical protein
MILENRPFVKKFFKEMFLIYTISRNAVNCCLHDHAAQPPRLPLGEAVATIGASKPIVVTDEGLNRTE